MKQGPSPFLRENSSLISPLRYPGGKRRLVGYLKEALRLNSFQPELYVEPFAGGASVALQLLNDGAVKTAILGEKDPLVAGFWRTVFWNHEKLIDEVLKWIPSLDEWDRLKKYNPKSDLGKAKKCLFLNRTSFSGILSDTAGPIGGRSGNSDYPIGCRFSADRIAKRIAQASSLSGRILDVVEGDWQLSINRSLDIGVEPENMFVYLDPPFYEKADRLYRYYFDHSQHLGLRDELSNAEYNFVISYDAHDEIINMYSGRAKTNSSVQLLYSATGSQVIDKASEFVASSLSVLPSKTRLWRTNSEWSSKKKAV